MQVLGGFDSETNDHFLVKEHDRSVKILIAEITKHIEPGSITL